MKRYKVGIIGGTGMVGQRFALLLADHPWFEVRVIAASPRSAGKTYEEAVKDRWAMTAPIPEALKNIVVKDAADVQGIATEVDFVFCAVDMPKAEIRALEEAYAKAECPVVSNNSANRTTPDVPMIIPELNPEHAQIIPAQRARLGTKRGFIAVKSNCSLQSYVPALFPLSPYGVTKVLVCTYQAISGAGKTFERWPEMVDNMIPYIGGEEQLRRILSVERTKEPVNEVIVVGAMKYDDSVEYGDGKATGRFIWPVPGYHGIYGDYGPRGSGWHSR